MFFQELPKTKAKGILSAPIQRMKMHGVDAANAKVASADIIKLKRPRKYWMLETSDGQVGGYYKSKVNASNAAIQESGRLGKRVDVIDISPPDDDIATED